MPTHIAFTRGLPLYESEKTTSPPTLGTPMQLPYPEIPDTAPSNRYRFRGESKLPKRREFRSAIGRAPMAKMSRTMPPIPVAAPSYGSTAEG